MLKIIFFVIFIYAAAVFFLYLTQRQLIYFPDHSLPSPADSDVPDMQVVTLQTEDNLTLTAWYHPSKHAQFPTLVYFHGNAGNIGHRGIIVMPFLKEGYGILLVTYRGYSRNPGTPSEDGLYQDARAALHFLQSQDIPNSCIVLYGESIGTAVAIQMAAEYPVGALILQSPFTSLSEIGQFHYPIFPVKWLLKDTFNSLVKVKQIHVPTLVIYGKNDDIIPPEFSIRLFEAIPSLKQIRAVSHTGHNDLFNPTFAINFIQNHVKCFENTR